MSGLSWHPFSSLNFIPWPRSGPHTYHVYFLAEHARGSVVGTFDAKQLISPTSAQRHGSNLFA